LNATIFPLLVLDATRLADSARCKSNDAHKLVSQFVPISSSLLNLNVDFAFLLFKEGTSTQPKQREMDKLVGGGDDGAGGDGGDCGAAVVVQEACCWLGSASTLPPLVRCSDATQIK
jgi:hypothetical protein